MSDDPRHRADGWQRWSPADLGTPRAPAVPPPPASHPTAEPSDLDDEDAFDPAQLEREIEALRAAAQARGHAEGYAAGHAQGLAAGKREGLEAGQSEGRQTGHQQALAEGSAHLNAQATRLATVADACALAVEQLHESVGESLVTLAIQLARQVAGDTLAHSREHLLSLVADLLHQDGPTDERLTLRVHPDDEALLRTYLSEHAQGRRWRLLADPGTTPGGCVVETPHGHVDARVETRWRRSVAALGHHTPWQADDTP